MMAVCSEGGGVEVDDSNMTMTESLRKKIAVARSEGGVEAAACSEDRDEATTCSGAGIMDDRWRRRRGSF
jgi:hypothetical protein